MTGRERVVLTHPYAIYEREGDVREVVLKPFIGSVGIYEVLESLRSQTGYRERSGCQDTVSDAAEKEQQHAHYVWKPLRYLRVIPIEYITRVRVAIAQEEM